MAAVGEVAATGKFSAALDDLAKIEASGEEILADKHQLIDLDKRKNGNREAMRALHRKNESSKKSWLCIGNMFFKLDDSQIHAALEHDQTQLDIEIENIRNNLTRKVSDLHQLEGLKEVKGYSLASMTADDLKFIKEDS